MSSTQTPIRPPEQEPEQEIESQSSRNSKEARRARYRLLDDHELLHVIDDLEDERSRARRREFIWISLLFHLLLFWFLAYGPQVLWHQPRVINPSDIIRDRKDLTYLDTPPDIIKRPRPKSSDVISDKDQIAQTRKPTLDRKTLQQLQAMKPAGPPAPAPPPPQQQAMNTPPAPPAPTVQQQTPQQPLAPNPQSQLDAPRPAPTRPNFNTGGLAGDQVRQAANQAANGTGAPSGDYGANAPMQHPGVASGAEILSDTLGVDFGPYMKRVVYATQKSWDRLIPLAAQPPLYKKGTVTIDFIIQPDGTVKNMILRLPSGDVSLDRAAWGGITGAAPFPQLPREFKGPYLALRFTFLYNHPDR